MGGDSALGAHPPDEARLSPGGSMGPGRLYMLLTPSPPVFPPGGVAHRILFPTPLQTHQIRRNEGASPPSILVIAPLRLASSPGSEGRPPGVHPVVLPLHQDDVVPSHLLPPPRYGPSPRVPWPPTLDPWA